MREGIKRKNNKGFSLVELIVVIAIMAVLIGVLAPQFLGYVGRSRQAIDIQNAQALSSEIAARYADAEAGLYTMPASYVQGSYIQLVSGDNIVEKIPALRVKPDVNCFWWCVDNSNLVHIAIAPSKPSDDSYDVYPVMGPNAKNIYDKVAPATNASP